MSIKYIDMFSGIGGFRSGLEAVGGFECIRYCEIDQYARRAYEAMYDTEGEVYFEDAAKINPDDLPDIDLICGGFPCQAFSIAGRRNGFNDTRGTLFFEIARIAAVKKPALLFLENVPGLLSHGTFATILNALDEIGYAIMKTAKENADVLKILKSHIAMGLNADSINDNSIELQIRIAEIDAEWQKVINATTTENENDDDRESLMEKLLTEKNQLKKQLEEIELLKKNKELTLSRLDEIYSTIDLLRNHPITYDNQIVREILECVVVESKERMKVVFKGGVECAAGLYK